MKIIADMRPVQKKPGKRRSSVPSRYMNMSENLIDTTISKC
jgi:hypothetical protein